MTTGRSIYRIVRSILFSTIGLIAVLYLSLYVALSIPYVQDKISRMIEKELSNLVGSDVSISSIDIYPFNEAVVHGLSVKDLSGKECLKAEKVGAGIDLINLIIHRNIVITYAELLGVDTKITQARPDQPLNIQFLIDAFSSKEKYKPPTKFDLALHSIVIRNLSASFDKEWLPRGNSDKIDFNHLFIRNFNADVDIPRLSNDDYIIDLRRLSLEGPSGLSLRTLSLKAHVIPTSISVRDFILKLPNSDIRPADFSLTFPSFAEIGETLRTGDLKLVMIDSRVTPSDLAALYPPIRHLNTPYLISADISGNMENLIINELSLNSEINNFFSLYLKGTLDGMNDIRNSLSANVDALKLDCQGVEAKSILESFVTLPEKASGMLAGAGNISLEAEGNFYASTGDSKVALGLSSSVGDLTVEGEAHAIGSPVVSVNGELAASHINLGELSGRDELGIADLSVKANGRVGKGILDGEASVDIESLMYRGKNIDGISAQVSKSGKDIEANIESEYSNALLSLDGSLYLDGKNTGYRVEADISSFCPSEFGFLPEFSGYVAAGVISAEGSGNSLENITGYLRGRDLSFKGNGSRGSIALHDLDIEIEENDGIKSLSIASDFLDADIYGEFNLKTLPLEFRCLMSHVIPAFFTCPPNSEMNSIADYDITIKPCDRLLEFFNSPVRVLVPIPLKGDFNMREMTANLSLDLPFFQQGKDKLVQNTYLLVSLDGMSGRGMTEFHTIYPSKKGEAELIIDLIAAEGDLSADLSWKIEKMKGFAGTLSMSLDTDVTPFENDKSFKLRINPTTFKLSGADWTIGESLVSYADQRLVVDNFNICHEDQYIRINGVASSSTEDVIDISLSEIDLGFIFETLNINYVTFGGIATGELEAFAVFSKDPVARTRKLFVKDLSYNDCVLGDGDIRSRWINNEKEVEIKASISSDRRKVAEVDGGVWVGADSLNFRIDTDKVDVAFLKPFMAAFTSDVGGRASGWVNLYGNFSDIDLKGRVFADSISMKVDFTNVYYHGSDSVTIEPGIIEIPGFKLYDQYGNSAMLTGCVKHRYFHEPSFEFNIKDAQKLLCYDTNPGINPVWYGRIFGNGGGVIKGWPGVVSIDVEMATAEDSNFTFVVSNETKVGEYNFLSFSDKRKEASKPIVKDTVPDFVRQFQKEMEKQMDIPSVVSLNLFGTVTPDALLTIVMDPVSGDRITARGSGPMQMNYNSESDKLSMYGKYTLQEGSYNFILQDLILRDFSIRQGSSISFNGDPLQGRLDIFAAYRVNTNLSDLDESFSYDPELNRTNVPVDAILAISGEMDHPDISFDIELPTLTSDVTRKVKSIISTDDMMSRQVLYLLALNRFYTPEYMGNSGSGGELASVASSTLSSQFSRIVGQLTDKVTLAPSFRTDKGDFSDFEMDLALSSRLLDNRLLLNGNFGYRDRSSSSTTFIGDFDIEYLLSRNGNLRLKAYNHFNDQNYYLKSSLTTQGIGVAYRKNFDNFFSFLLRKKKPTPPDSDSQIPENPVALPADSIKIKTDSLPISSEP